MKKIFMAIVLVAAIGLLSGCQSKKGGFDNADTASFDKANTSTDDTGNPPIPPEPTQ